MCVAAEVWNEGLLTHSSSPWSTGKQEAEWGILQHGNNDVHTHNHTHIYTTLPSTHAGGNTKHISITFILF